MSTWNPADKGSGITLSNGNLTFSTVTANAVRSVESVSAGAAFYEVTVTNQPVMGVGNSSASLANFPGVDANGIGYFSSGQIIKNNATLATVASYTTNDRIGVALDRTGNTVSFYKNGTQVGSTFTPPTGTLFMLGGANGVGSAVINNAPASIPSGYSLWGGVADHLAASAVGVSAASANLDIQHHLAAAAQSLASASSNVRVSHHLLAAASALASATATLDVEHDLAAIAASVATASASLDVQTVGQAHLSAAAVSRVATTAALDLQKHMTAASNAISNAFAGLDVQHHIAAAAQSVALATADLETLTHFQHLSAGAVSQSAASASVRVTRSSGGSAGNFLITRDEVIDFGFGRGRRADFGRGRQKTRSEREAMN